MSDKVYTIEVVTLGCNFLHHTFKCFNPWDGCYMTTDGNHSFYVNRFGRVNGGLAKCVGDRHEQHAYFLRTGDKDTDDLARHRCELHLANYAKGYTQAALKTIHEKLGTTP